MQQLKKKTIGLEDKLDIEPLPPIEIKKVDLTFNDDCHLDVNDDYRFIRQRLMDSISIGETVLNEAVVDLRNNLSARTIEACSTILKTIVDSSEKVLSLHEKMQKLIPPKEPEPEENDNKKKTITANINDILDQCD